MTVQTASLKGLDLLSEIERLKRERNAVILAHYYQKPEIQDLADFVGERLALSRKAAPADGGGTAAWRVGGVQAPQSETPERRGLSAPVWGRLAVARQAAATDADVIALCGVRFMAE